MRYRRALASPLGATPCIAFAEPMAGDLSRCRACGGTRAEHQGRAPSEEPRGLSRSAPAPGEITWGPEDEQRTDDLALLRALVAHLGSTIEAYDEPVEPCPFPADELELLGEEQAERCRLALELEAFASMLQQLSRRAALTPKQRAWAIQAAERLDLSWGDPGARNRNVPRGAEVALLVNAMPRPLAPPGRRQA